MWNYWLIFIDWTKFKEYIISADNYLFLKVNAVWTNHFLDSFLPIYRESIFWIPLYFFLLLFITMNFGKKSILWIILLIITIAVSDQISSNLIKNWVGRIRPCHLIYFQENGRLLLGRCSFSGSFTSSHATNHFALAMFVWISLYPILKKWGWLLMAWAASISYAQVYVGVHFPLDIIGGALLGCLIGYIFGKIANKYNILSLKHKEDHTHKEGLAHFNLN